MGKPGRPKKGRTVRQGGELLGNDAQQRFFKLLDGVTPDGNEMRAFDALERDVLAPLLAGELPAELLPEKIGEIAQRDRRSAWSVWSGTELARCDTTPSQVTTRPRDTRAIGATMEVSSKSINALSNAKGPSAQAGMTPVLRSLKRHQV